jgi:hypothetical protein
MNHQEVRQRLGEYLEGELALGQRALVDAHLDACPPCAAELRALRHTIGLLRELPGPELPAHLAERVVARVRDGEGRARWWDGLAAVWNAIDPSRYLPPLAAAALTSAVVIVGVRDLGWQIPGLRAPEPAAQAEAPAAPEPTRLAEAPRAPEAPAAPVEPSSPSQPAPRIYAFSPAPRAAVAPQSSQERVAAAAEVVPPAAGLQGPFGASAAPEEPASSRPGSAEADLELALEDPLAFVERFRGLRRPEAQEAFIAAVASHAARRRALADLTRRLRETAGPEGHVLATRVEGAAQAVAYPAEGR